MEEDYRIRQFKKNFSNTREPILIYGTGKGTHVLLPAVTEYNIVGILDRKLISGQISNIPIIDEKMAVMTGAHKLVIVAIPSNVIKIYHRISGFCEQNQIIAYDINGNDLSMICKKHEIDIPYFKKNWDDLYKEVEKYDVISFDIFDTLLVRKVLRPTDIFDIVEQRLKNTELKFLPYSKLRIAAVNNLCKKGLYPNIYEIYDELVRLSGISKKQKEFLIRLELRVEYEHIEARKSIQNFYNLLKDRKKIYLVSNMYLSKNILEEILKNCGYTGYSDILISCEYRKGKKNGLFNILKQKAKVEGNKILHIGDSEELDGVAAQNAGLNIYTILSKYDLLINSSYYELDDYAINPLNNIIIGVFAQIAFDNPFILFGRKGRLKANSMVQYVNMFFSPLVLYYSLWIIYKVMEMKYDYILYTSRDGYLIKQIIDDLVEKYEIENFPKGQYFYTSRRAVSTSGVFNREDIAEVAFRPFHGSLGQLFKIRFEIEISDDLYCLEATTNNIEKVIKKYSNEILKICCEERNNYLKYINKFEFTNYEHIAVVEQCGFGNVQRGISSLLNGKELHGIFLRKLMDSKRVIDYISFFPESGEWKFLNNLSLANMEFEQFLSSPEPSLKCFDEFGNPVFGDEVRDEKQIKIFESMQEYAKKYCSEMSDVCADFFYNEPDWKVINCILGFLDEKYTEIQIDSLNNIVVEDNFGQGTSIKVNDIR